MNPLSPLTLLTTMLAKADPALPQPGAAGGFEVIMGELAQKSAALAPVASVEGLTLTEMEAAPAPTDTASPRPTPAAVLTAVTVQRLPDRGKQLPPTLPLASDEAPTDAPESATPDKPRAKGRSCHLLPEAAVVLAAETAQPNTVPFLTLPEAPAETPAAATPPLTAISPAVITPPPADTLEDRHDQPAASAARTHLLPDPPIARLIRAPQAAPIPIAAPLEPVSQLEAAPPAPPLLNPAPQQDVLPASVTAPLRQFQTTARRGEVRSEPSSAPLDPAVSALLPPSESTPTPATPSLRSLDVSAVSRPHDFAALVDRLVAAREAVQPHSVSIALPHAEFGHVSLRFHRDEAGLSVSMASPDPDFARAASLALPPVQQAAPSETSTTGSGLQHNQSERGAAPGDQSAQSRQPSPERRVEREVLRNPAGTNHREPAGRPRQQGIFA